MRDFKKVRVWQLARVFTVHIYQMTETFPRQERFRLSNQLCRATASIAANIAEGCSRSTTKDYTRFLEIAIGSANEVENHLILAADLGYIDEDVSKQLNDQINHIRASLIRLIRHMNPEYR